MANGRGGPGGSRGPGSGNQQPKTAVGLVPTKIDQDKREICVKATANKSSGGTVSPAQGSVIFSRGNNPEMNGLVLLTNGEATWTYTIPEGLEQVTLKVEMVDGTGYREISIQLPATKKKEEKKQKVVEKVFVVKGVYTFFVRGATPDTPVITNSGIPILVRSIPCGPSGNWHESGLRTNSKGDLDFQLKVAEEAARGDLFFCVGEFRSEHFWVADAKPPLRGHHGRQNHR